MNNSQTINKTFALNKNEFAFVPYTLSGATGIFIGWLIAGYIGII